VKIHGSALEYTVKPHPRFKPYAVEGLARARGILVGSRHTAESLWAEMDDPTVTDRTRLGPPGVDVERFVPRGREEAQAGLDRLRATLEAADSGPAADDSFARSTGEAAAALATIAPDDRLVVFVGKLIASKGVELLLAAWPLVLAAEPRARLLIVGFGAFRPGLEGLARDLASGDLEAARALRSETGAELPHLAAFLDSVDRDRYDGRGMTERIAWAGRLDHDEVADVLPAAEAMVMPSTFPEAFGMVAAEAAACGALPLVANHSGMAEVARTLAAAAPPEAAPWLTFTVGPDAVTEIAADLTAWLAAGDELRAATREAIVAATREHYSWEGVARSVIAAAQGELGGLPRPAPDIGANG
jgi:glycosyltransferase involved in cell wall biosynthesis